VAKSDEPTPEIESSWPEPLVAELKVWVIKAIQQVALREREACAQLAEAYGAGDVAADIRARPAPLVFVREEEQSPSRSPGPAPAERRAVPRWKEGDGEITLAEADGGTGPFPGRLMDHSEGGVGIQVDREVAQGAFLDARPANSQDAPAVRLQVRYCISTGRGWRVGCQFVGTSRQAIMSLLGLCPPPEGEEQPS